MSSFGVGLGQFIDGFQSGMGRGKQIKQQFEDNSIERKVRKAEKTGRADADLARNTDIAKGITTVVDPATGQARYSVGGQDYGTDQGAASKASEQSVGSFTDYYMKTAVPKIVDTYIRQGRPQEAEKYQTWLETDTAKRGMKSWASAARAANRNDQQGFIKHAVETMNISGVLGRDGTTATRGEVTKDKEGKDTGIRIFFKGDDGKEYSQDYSGMEDTQRMALHLLSPEELYKSTVGDVNTAKATNAEIAKERREQGYKIQTINQQGIIDDTLDGRKNERSIFRDNNQHSNNIERDNNNSVLDTNRDSNGILMRNAYPTGSSASEDASDVKDFEKNVLSYVRTRAETDMDFAKKPYEEQVKEGVAALNTVRQASGRGGGGSNAVNPNQGAPSLY